MTNLKNILFLFIFILINSNLVISLHGKVNTEKNQNKIHKIDQKIVNKSLKELFDDNDNEDLENQTNEENSQVVEADVGSGNENLNLNDQNKVVGVNDENKDVKENVPEVVPVKEEAVIAAKKEEEPVITTKKEVVENPIQENKIVKQAPTEENIPDKPQEKPLEKPQEKPQETIPDKPREKPQEISTKVNNEETIKNENEKGITKSQNVDKRIFGDEILFNDNEFGDGKHDMQGSDILNYDFRNENVKETLAKKATQSSSLTPKKILQHKMRRIGDRFPSHSGGLGNPEFHQLITKKLSLDLLEGYQENAQEVSILDGTYRPKIGIHSEVCLSEEILVERIKNPTLSTDISEYFRWGEITEERIKMHVLRGLALKQFAHVGRDSFMNVDGRIERPIISTSGGDAGEFLLTLNVFEKFGGGKFVLTDATVEHMLIHYLLNTNKHSFIMTVDTFLLNNLCRTMRFCAPKFRLDSPPAHLYNILRKALTHQDNQGSVYFSNLLRFPDMNRFNTPKRLTVSFLSAFYNILWGIPQYNQLSPTALQICQKKLKLVALQGPRTEKALVQVSTSACNDKVPMLIPEIADYSVSYQYIDAAKEFRKYSVQWLADYSKHVQSITTPIFDENQFVSVMNDISMQQTLTALSLDRGNTPLFSVSIPSGCCQDEIN